MPSPTPYRDSGQVILDAMFVGVGEVTPPAGGPAVAFCAWVRHLGEEARLLIPLAALSADQDVRRMVGELGADGVDVFVNQRSPGQYFTGAQLIHMDAELLLDSPGASALQTAVDAARRQGALLSLQLGNESIRRRGADAVAYDLAGIHPDIVFAGGSAAAELGGSLPGIASIPVIELESGGCSVYGRHLRAPAAGHDQGALAAAFCVAFMEGATPVEAAGRAVLVASAR